MKTWIGKWRFRDVMHYLHGSTGTERVQASSEESARSQIQEKASRQLFDTSMMMRYVHVELEEDKSRY